MVGDILQPTHLLFILVVALLVLGPKRLPEVGRTLGSGLRDFRQAINGDSSHDEHEPHGYVETEPEIDTGPAFADEQPAATAVEEHDVAAEEHDVADEPSWTPSPETDTGPAFSGEQLEAEPGSETTAVQAAGPGAETTAVQAAEPGADTTAVQAAEPEGEATAVQAAEPAPAQSATASSSGFASALAASRRQPADDPAGDE